MKSQHWLPLIILSAAVTTGAQTVFAQETPLLDGTELEYRYSDGGAVVLTFYDGLLRFRWIAGPSAGATGEDFPYRARMIADNVYVINWHMTDAKNFVTLIVNLQSNSLYSSALMGYESDQEQILFDEATIERVER